MGKYTEEAAEKLRSYARFIDKNAEQIVGDLDSIYVADGIEVSFRLTNTEAPLINVGKSYFAIDRKPRGAAND